LPARFQLHPVQDVANLRGLRGLLAGQAGRREAQPPATLTRSKELS
jgi:hypothetical protein